MVLNFDFVFAVLCLSWLNFDLFGFRLWLIRFAWFCFFVSLVLFICCIWLSWCFYWMCLMTIVLFLLWVLIYWLFGWCVLVWCFVFIFRVFCGQICFMLLICNLLLTWICYFGFGLVLLCDNVGLNVCCFGFTGFLIVVFWCC